MGDAAACDHDFGFGGQTVVIHVFPYAADAVAAHFSPRAIGIVHFHFEIAFFFWQPSDQDDTISSDAEVTVRKESDEPFLCLFVFRDGFSVCIDIDIVVSTAVHFGKVHKGLLLV